MEVVIGRMKNRSGLGQKLHHKVLPLQPWCLLEPHHPQGAKGQVRAAWHSIPRARRDASDQKVAEDQDGVLEVHAPPSWRGARWFCNAADRRSTDVVRERERERY